MTDLDLFEEFTTKVADVRRPDNMGYIEGPKTIIKAGPLSCLPGKEVEAMLISKENAVCLTRSAVADDYVDYLNNLAKKYDLSEEIESNSVLVPGDEFTSKVEKIRSDSIGLVYNNVGERIYIGPVSCETGEIVQLEYLGDGIAKCLNESVQAENYEIRLNIFIENYDSVPVSTGDTFIGRTIRSFSDESIVDVNDVHIHINDVELEVGEFVEVEVTEFAVQSARGQLTNKNIKTDKSTSETDQDEAAYVETRRRERDSDFAEKVKKSYKKRCAVCGQRRISPDGNPEVEAAHIHPKGEGGPDILSNGVALCKLHHWAFDAGWISFTDEYKIIIKECPDLEGYEDFNKYAGDELYLPDKNDKHPEKKYVSKHRKLNNFDN